MIHRKTWHDQPFLAPMVYGMSSFTVGYPAYLSAYLLTGQRLHAVCWMLFVDVLLVAYLLECRRTAKARCA